VANTEKTEKIFARKSSTDHYRALHRTSESRKCNNQTRVLFAFAHRAENILEQRINPKNRLSALSSYKREGATINAHGTNKLRKETVSMSVCR